ncbi:hypothetical protein AC579_3124 [Pseudocercospora musae]|uniref:Steroid 5-alpha reductase C-terminal domain-containing protein n=1 Tax=Pseudocercospora musae TaxID=113226 RepID=A0A139IA43_9PEZI|nr:hypothetical protein AC579_3124 [Pseudocercospora musae]
MTAAATSAGSDLPTVENVFRSQRPHLGIGQPLGALSIFEHSILPSFSLHGGLSMIACGIAYSTNRVELKDYLWPSGMVLNAWYTAVGRHVLSAPHPSVSEVLGNLSYSQRLLLGAVTAWGGRLFYRIVKRSVRRGKDDPRYENVKDQNYFWHKAPLLFGLEAVFQTLISLPFTLPFRADLFSRFTGAPTNWASTVRWTAAGLFTAGLALETLADWQLDSHKQQEETEEQDQGKRQHGDILQTGVWSIARNPNYLGDALIHLSFPLWCYGSQLFSYSQLLGPIANYFFLRWIGGDREKESYQLARYKAQDRHKHAQMESYQLQKHAFWPSILEIANPWTWIVTGIGAAGAAAEYLYESRIVAATAPANLVNPVVGETLAALES